MPAAAAASLGKPKGWRKWLYRLLAATLMPALLLVLLEFGLRIFGYGYPTSYFIERSGPGWENVYTENPQFGQRFFPPGLNRELINVALPKVKAPGACRVFILGESAAMGFPDPSGGFARILEVLLRDRHPDVRFEVVNVAVTAINSHAVLPIARECAQHQPDFFVVHMGNNEVVGPFGAAGVIGAHAPSLRMIRANLLAKQTRTGQLLGNLMRSLAPGKSPRVWDGMAMFQKSKVSEDDPRLIATRAHFRQNLADICQAGIDAHASVIVCTVPVNLKDSAPFASLHTPGLSEQLLQTWDQAYQAGVKLEDAGQHAQAHRLYDEATGIDEKFADLAFRRARCALRLGKLAEARSDFARARDLDALRFRSDSAINDTIRAVAVGLSPQQVHLVDAERDFAAASPDGIPGDDLFYEHVHMNFSGNYRLARAVFDTMTTLIAKAPRDGAEPLPALTERQCARQLAYVGWNQLRAATEIHGMLLEPPFNQQLDQAQRLERWNALLEKLRAQNQPEELKRAIGVYEKAIRRAPDDWMIRENFANLLVELGLQDRAIEHYQAALTQMPHCFRASRLLGNLWAYFGNVNKAQACFQAALAIEPNYTFAHYEMAKLLIVQGKVKEGIALVAARVNQEPNRAEALAVLADFEMNFGSRDQALARIQEALALNPNESSAHMVLGRLAAKEGDAQQAVVHFDTALRCRPSLLPEVTTLKAALRKPKAAAPIR